MKNVRMQALGRWIVTMVALIVIVSGCSGDSDGSDLGDPVAATVVESAASESAGEDAADQALNSQVAERVAQEGGDALGNGGVATAIKQDAQSLNQGREIIFTAQLTVSVPDVAAASQQATDIVESFGGFLFGQQSTGSPQPSSVLTFRILPEDFQKALSALGEVGDLRTQVVSTDDVTERVVDLESRITTTEASVERIRGFLENATKIEDIAELEAQLLERETNLETMRGSLRTLRDQVALATITLSLTEAGVAPAVILSVSAYPGADDVGTSCPGDDGFTVEEGSDVTVCFEIRNEGDAALTNFALRDSVFEIDIDDLVAVFGDPSDTLQPGQSMVLAYETTVERTLRTQTRIEATPLDTDGVAIPNRMVANTQSITVGAVAPDELPGFTAGVRTTIDFLANVWDVIVLAAGLILPLIWLIPLVWWLRRRRGDREEPALTTQ